MSPVINIYMKDTYTNAFYDLVKSTQTNTGYDLPHHIEAYIVMLLSDFVERDDIPPDDTFAEMFCTLKSSQQAKQLGDTCLIIAGAFPTYKRHRGINRRYFQDIGSTSYDMASAMNDDLFPLLSKHFVFLSTFIEHSVSSSKHAQNILYR